MSLSSIGSVSSLTTSNLLGVSRPSGSSCGGDSSSDSQQSNGISRFTTAIQNAFASLGISLDTSSSTSASTTSSTASGSTTDTTSTASTDTTDAVSSFLQSLFAALHSQSAGSAPPPATSSDDASTSDSDSSTRTASVGHGHHHHGGKLEGDLQSLISELTTSSASTTDSSTTAGTTTDASSGTTTASTTSSDPTLSTLEKNFDALLAQNGVATATGTDTLATFLQSLASSLHGAPATGNVVSTAA